MNKFLGPVAGTQQPNTNAKEFSTRIPLSPYQRDIWVASMQFPDLDQYTIFICDQYSGDVDVSALQKALIWAADRTDVFHLRLGEEDGTPYQWFAGEPVFPVTIVDLTGEADPITAAEVWLRDAFRVSYKLDGANLVDIAIVQTPNVVYTHVRTHHIVSDAWGLQFFMRQVRAEYLRTIGIEVQELASQPFVTLIQADSYLGSDQYREDQSYFAAALAGVEPALFNRKRPNGARQTARHMLNLERALIAKIRDQGQSPFVFISAAVALYLAKIHQVNEVVLGIPILNRDITAKQTVGHFANTLPLRIEIDPIQTAAEFVAKLRDETRSLLRHQRMPLGELMRGQAPLFDTTISYMRWPNPQPIPGVSYETIAQTHAHDSDVLAIWVSEFDSHSDVRVDFEYACDVFDTDFPIESAVGQLETVLRALVENGDDLVRSFDPLSPDERQNLVYDRNATSADFPAHITLPELLAMQIERTPDQAAIIEPDGTIVTFFELSAKVQAVATALRAEGVSPDDRVAILVERGKHQLPAILGVHLAGGAYVPIDPTYPTERIRLLLEDCGANVAIVGDLEMDMSEIATLCKVLRMADLPPSFAELLTPIATPTNLAYVIYTSGSTGKPKGVMVEHRSVVNRLWWMQRRYPIDERDVLLQKTPMSFDVSVWELFWWSFTGARLSLLPPGAEKDPQEVLRAVERNGVTVIHFVPSMLSPLLDLLESDPKACDAAASLRYVFCSGEALAPGQVARFNRIFGGKVSLVNLYGPTEATVDVSYFDCLPATLARVPIGKPIDNIQLHVLDNKLRPQPSGAPGELYIGGIGVARGYLNRPDLNIERFIPDPFFPGSRLYRTGDLARWLADGTVEYLGRADDQVKIRGNRVEPNEVRDQLSALPGIRDAVVIARQSEVRGMHLIGYYIAGEDLDATALRAGLAVVLPEFMIPAFFIRISEIPLTANGKLDRKRLPSPHEASVSVSPRTAVEAELAAVWAEVLDVEAVGVFDDFYALGGDSILMLRVRAGAQRLGLSFELADLIRNPTVAGLAKHVRPVKEIPKRGIEPFALVSEVDRPKLAGFQDAFPVGRLSLGLLYHTSQHPESPIYRDVFRYHFDIAWDEIAFRRAIEIVVGRYPSLRSSFDLASYSEPLQLIHETANCEPLIADLRERIDAEDVISRHIHTRRFHQYEMDKAPLYQFAVFVRETGLDLVFSFHHAILDGWSVASLIVALITAFRGEPVAGDMPPLASYLQAERGSLTSMAHARYWSELLDGAAMTKLDGFSPYESAKDDDIGYRLNLPDELVARVKAAAVEHSLPLKSILLAAHCLTLHMFSQSDTVVTGLVTHGRPDLDGADRMVGLFLNTVPVRSEINGKTWVEVARALFRQEQEGHPYRRYPLSAIQAQQGDSLQSAFNYVNLHVFEQIEGLNSFDVWEETNFSPLINVIADPAGSGMYIRVDTGGHSFGRAQIALIAETYVEILRRIVDSPEEGVDFGFLEYRRNVTPRSEPLIDAISHFERQVEKNPNNIAVAFEESTWTYSELDRMARSVATRLQSKGARPGDTIGVALARSVEQIATVLGVLRAGLVCVPLDVSYPEHRLALIMETAHPYRVIAHPEHAHVAPENLVLPVAEMVADIESAQFSAPALDDLALILFTSGSTGRPKGVELTHRTWANFIEWQLKVPSGVPGARTLQFAPLSFDVAYGDIFSALCSGGELRLVSDQDRLDPFALLALLDRHKVQRVALPFVALQRLAEASNALGLRPRALRVVISSGEQLRMTEQLRTFCEGVPGLLVENQYGPTEAYVVSSHSLTGDPRQYPDLPPIGVPLDGIEIQVLDKEMRAVPIGVVGEIYLGGECLARGYFEAPDLTQERFVAHPWRAGAKLYRTGDLGRVLRNGDIVWLGRADSQVKVRGFRIEPSEIELAVMRQTNRHPGIQGVAVVARERVGGDSFLAAFLTGEQSKADIGELKKVLRTELPDYMVPTQFVWIDGFPLTPSGKRDDVTLKTRRIDQEIPAEKISPRDEYEDSLCDILAELLDLPEVGVRDNFFALGGTSLTAMRFVVTVEKRYGINVPIAALIETPTVEGLADRLRTGTAARKFDPLVALRSSGRRPPLFLVHPLGGHVLCYMPLARSLPSDQPVYALQAAGSDQGSTPVSTIEEMAANYLKAIQQVQPKGPYVLAGWSFGGFVVYEMAQQLRANDPNTIVHVIMLDSIAKPPNHDVNVTEEALLEFFYWELVWFERIHTEVEALPTELTNDQKLDHIVERAIANGVLPMGTSRVTIRRLYDLFRANWNALMSYKPKETDADVALLRASGPLPSALMPMHRAAGTFFEDAQNGWQHWITGNLSVINVPGDHLNLMSDPNVGTVATVISDLIASLSNDQGQIDDQ